MRAELLLDKDGNAADEAGTLFGQSLEISRRQQAKTFELRTATSLARLCQRQGKRRRCWRSWRTRPFCKEPRFTALLLRMNLAE